MAPKYFAEAIGPARASGDRWRLSQILASQAGGAILAGDPIAVRAAAEEGSDLADAIGDRSNSRRCRCARGVAQSWQGDLAGAVARFREVAAEAEAAHDDVFRSDGLACLGMVLALQGDTDAARAAADAAVEAAAELGRLKGGVAYVSLAAAALAAGDPATARDAAEAAPWFSVQVAGRHAISVEAALAGGDLIAARRRGRRRGRDRDRLLADVGADHARQGGDRAG